jgi:hypothetical protein
MSPFLAKYIVLWVFFCLLAAAILARDRKSLRAEWRDYFRFLCVPWKLVVFVPALVFVTFAGRFTDDETWDVVTGSGMSVLTFITAPWSVGLFYQALMGGRAPRYVIVSVALCLFSSSWFYDGYLFWRDGSYTPRWLGNLLLSPIIYLAAGLLWNLEAKAGGGFRFSFTTPDWPKPPVNTSFRPLLLISIPLILIAAFVLVAFVRWKF